MVKHQKPLIVYKASAGSGKTFTLATEYIKLLVKNPQSYRSILAVTFTNKATEEMKMRIISQLYGIWQQLPDSDNYAKKVMEATGFDYTTISQRAGQALQLLLHDYDNFRVQTIDAFFQSVLRNLARELELTANLRVGINGDQAEELAVDQMIDSLQHTDKMLQWLVRYILENISESQTWSNSDDKRNGFLRSIKNFGKKIYDDHYKEHREQLNKKLREEGFFERYSQQLLQMRAMAKERMKNIGTEYFDTLAEEFLDVSDIKGGQRGVSSFFRKLTKGVFDASIVNTTTLKALEDASQWCTQKHPQRQAIMALADSVLMPLLHKAIDERERQWRIFQSAQLTLTNLNNLRLLDSIERQVVCINDEANIFLLGNTQHLLHQLMHETDSPFVFEKIGAQLRHVMIDEFQDTSTIQWQNFRVLMNECMSHRDAENLIVGDVKQSIYRWRSGDWQLLNSINDQFPQEMMDVLPLQTNYRSDRRIIEFNNAFFSLAVKAEKTTFDDDYPEGATALQKAYSDVCQQVSDSRDKPSGYVEVRLLPRKDYEEAMLCEITQTIERLEQQGIGYDKMAILVRKNSTITLIANYLAAHRPDIPLVSDEAYRLDASAAVVIMVSALHLLTHPSDVLAKAYLVKRWQRDVMQNSSSDDELLLRTIDPDSLLPEAYTAHTEELLRLPLYELAEKLYSAFELHRINNQTAYVCAFYDHLTKFVQENSTDIDAFVELWEQDLCKKTIHGERTGGITILTIHKSKGLEYDHVIAPFCDWALNRGDTVWCVPREEPFSQLPVTPIEYSPKMEGTIFENDYQRERLQLTVDNLNLLYVMLTRACRSLFIIGKRKSKGRRSMIIEQLLPDIQPMLEGSSLDIPDNEDEPITFGYGSLEAPAAEEQKTTDNVFLQHAAPLPITMEKLQSHVAFRQSNKSKEFLLDAAGDDSADGGQDYIQIGSVLHNVFSTIRTTADIDAATQQLECDGVLPTNGVDSKRLIELIRHRLEDKRVAEWFSGRWNLFNECTILATDADGKPYERRPDRVMTDGKRTIVVDFKFGSPREEHKQQVKEYISLLSTMGHANVEGYLWYVYSNKIISVEP